MKISTFAAATMAAGMMIFAAEARETYNFAAVENATAADSEADKADTASPVNPRAGQSPVLEATSRKGRPDRPHLNAVARKRTVVKGGAEPTGTSGPAGRDVKGAYRAIISRYAATYGVPVTLAHAVVRVESNYRANARGAAGEIGLMQIKPATARAMGYSGSTSGLFNPETNIRFGMKYLGMAHRLSGGTTCGTILRYNAGHGARRMNPVSAAYCRKVQRLGA